MQAPVLVMSQSVKRDEGYKVQLQNIVAAKAVAEVIRTSLGPRAMLKMLLDPMGGIVLTNDGSSILREIDVSHPAAKSMVEISRAQDEEVGDGTTSAIVLAGEIMAVAHPLLERKIHPSIIVEGYKQALDDALDLLNTTVAIDIDVEDDNEMSKLIGSCIGTKMIKTWAPLATQLALKAVRTVRIEHGDVQEIDIKRYAKVEKVPGGDIGDSEVLNGIMLNKDVTHSHMRRRIVKPRIVLLDCTLEYKKGESQTNIEIIKESTYTALLQQEEEEVKQMCNDILAVKPDLIFTEKGISDLAQHYFVQAGVTAIRRVRKSDNNRLARACGATIVSRTDEVKESDVGTGAGLFEVKKLGDEYFTFITECENPKACTVLLRGASKDILKEVERNLQDAMCVARNAMLSPKLCPGGGATEMALAAGLQSKASGIDGVQRNAYLAVASALEIIPKTLAENCGANVIRTLTKLRALHAQDGHTTWGLDGNTGDLADMALLGVWDPVAVRAQAIKTAIEVACMMLRIDMIVSGLKKKKEN